MSRPNGRSDVIDLTGTLVRETDKAILFDNGTAETWLAKSQIEYNPDDLYSIGDVTLPEWLAKEKGLI